MFIGRTSQARGFSLVELLIVLAIAGILGSMSVGYILAARPHAELERAEMELIGNLNAARHLAISEEVQVRMQFDTDVTPPEYWAEKYDAAAAAWVASGLPLYIFPTGVSLQANSFASEIVQFNTRGGLVSGGALTLQAANGETSVISGNLASGRFQYGAGNTR